MYAIIETGGKQYRVTPGDVVSLEKLDGSVGQTVTFDKVLLIGGQADAAGVLVGTPYVSQASLQAEIVDQTRGEKLLTIKYRRRKGYRRMIGHRQSLTRILVTKIDDGRGHALSFESSKRKEILMKASVPFAVKTEKKAKASTTGEAKTKKTAAAKKPTAKAKKA